MKLEAFQSFYDTEIKPHGMRLLFDTIGQSHKEGERIVKNVFTSIDTRDNVVWSVCLQTIDREEEQFRMDMPEEVERMKRWLRGENAEHY